MTKTVTYNAATTLSTVPPDSITAIEIAHMGEAGIGHLTIHDSAGTIATVGHKALTITESTAPSGNRRVYTGRVGSRHITRGQFPVGAGREIEVDLVDVNVMLGDYVITGTDGNRSAESVTARLTWLLASSYVAFADHGYVVYPAGSMDPTDYRGQTAGDVLADCAKQVGFNYFLYYDETDDAIGLWFDDPISSSAYSTTTKISNVAADVDSSSVFAPFMDAELTRDPSKIASGVYVPYAKGAEYRTNATTATTFTHRDIVATDANTKTAANAQALGDRLLDENSTEDDTVSVTVQLKAANVNDIRAGQLLQAKFSHFAPEAYDSYSYFRVVQRTLTQPQNTDDRWDVPLELTPATPVFATFSSAWLLYDHGQDPTTAGGSRTLNFEGTGDSPPVGWVSHALTGNMAYDTTGAYVGGYSTGIKMLGTGSISVGARASFEFGYTSGTGYTVYLTVCKNGTVVATGTVITDIHAAGIHIFVGYPSISASGLAVVTNDIITVKMNWTGGDPHSATIPYAIPDPDTEYLTVSGYLA